MELPGSNGWSVPRGKPQPLVDIVDEADTGQKGGVWPFVVIVFGITWTIAVMVLFFDEWFVRTFGELSATSPWFYLAVWAPNIAALLLTFAYNGPGGIARLMKSLVKWRAPLAYWALALLAYPAMLLVIHTLKGDAFTPHVWVGAAADMAALSVLTLGPIGEELGWRGYLLPRLIARIGSLKASLITGAVWMIWHFPAFKVATLSQSSASYPVFFATGLSLSIFMTWLYNRTRGSVLIAGVIPHLVANAFSPLTDYSWVQAVVLLSTVLTLVMVTKGRLGEPT